MRAGGERGAGGERAGGEEGGGGVRAASGRRGGDSGARWAEGGEKDHGREQSERRRPRTGRCVGTRAGRIVVSEKKKLIFVGNIL